VFTSTRLAAGLLILAAGCVTRPPQPTGTKPPDWDAEHDLPPVSEPAAGNPATLRPAAEAPTAPHTPVAVPSPPPETRPPPDRPRSLPPEQTWISLRRWAAERGFPPPHCLSVAPLASFSQTTTHGVLLVQESSLKAYWDQLELRLGFNPQFIGGQIFLHALDLEKNVEPLLRGLDRTGGSKRVIVIDPGHGGPNRGTRSAADGRWEKEFTLDWALRLAPLLERSGWQVLLTRTKDEDVSLPGRVAFAEARQADLFLSLHFNHADGGGDQAGVETYCVTPAGLPSSLTRGYSDDPNQVFPNNAFDTENFQYAMKLHRALLGAGLPDRGVRRARFLTVLRGQKRPAVLIEGGYLSNPTEAARIGQAEYRQQLAEAVAKALE
jgi:N-acetylmuramoyl-L-alanine amidase